MVTGVVVVRVGPDLPVRCVVPKLCEGRVAGGFAPVQAFQEVGVDGLAPAVKPGLGNLQGLCHQVFLGVDQVHQVAQGSGGVSAATDVHVDAATGVRFCAGGSKLPHQHLYRFNVLPGANRADQLGAFRLWAFDAGI